MQPSWQLEDGTRVELRSVANRESLSLFAPRQWYARVNGAAVPTDTRALRGSSTENRFKLSDGREAIARVLSLQGARICDLSVGDRTILYPGELPFRCPSCRTPVEPQTQTCISCKGEQPGYDARVFELQRRSIASSLLHSNLLCVVLGALQIVSSQPVRVLGSLQAADLATPHVLSGPFTPSPDRTLSWLAAYMLCIFGCAWLALEAPVLAALLNLLAFGFMLASHALTPDGSWVSILLAGGVMLWAFGTAERAIEMSQRAKKRQLASKA
jgi:hypothetical protein